MRSPSRRAATALSALAAVLFGVFATAQPPAHSARTPASASAHSGPDAGRAAAPAADGAEAAEGPPTPQRAHNDVLFIGAHPDDEYQSLATFGQMREKSGLSTGVATITRGEGGGNAVGPEEGAPLGMLREKEERKAVAHAGIRNVFYLDKPDSWYTLSAPLTGRLWNEGKQRTDTLERLVRLIRATTPQTVVTMDPRPFDQHGAHQEAARLAVEAYQLAADPSAFPRQLTREGYAPWQPGRLLAQNWGFQGPTGKQCADQRRTDPHTGLPVTGAWTGSWSREQGRTWAQAERDAARVYRSQGFGALDPRVQTPREKLGCEWFSVLAEAGEPVRAPVRSNRSQLRPLYADFRDWAERVGMPWLANEAQPDYPAAPSTTVRPAAKAPAVDGTAGRGEYGGPAARLEHWQGEERCGSDADCAATVRTARHGDDLYVFFDVRDDKKGAALKSSDCKRHWRTDAVEIALDPRGDSDDTSTVFKAGLLPFTKGGGACAARDADNRQGPVRSTAPGMRVASQVTSPYRGYRIEAKIPLRELPATADPRRLTANFLLYDSDTRDQAGQTRLAWSPYGSAQADPYVWGTARLPGYSPPRGGPTTPRTPEIPTEAARSADSPASVEQSRRTGVPLGVEPRHHGGHR